MVLLAYKAMVGVTRQHQALLVAVAAQALLRGLQVLLLAAMAVRVSASLLHLQPLQYTAAAAVVAHQLLVILPDLVVLAAAALVLLLPLQRLRLSPELMVLAAALAAAASPQAGVGLAKAAMVTLLSAM
jgi:hypothetical protein